MEGKSNVRKLSAISSNDHSSQKRHKKHKKHKHKHSKHDDDSDLFGQSDGDSMSSPQSSIKLKIKIGGHTVSTQSFSVAQDSILETEVVDSQICNMYGTKDKELKNEDLSRNYAVKTSKAAEDSSGDDETKWLDALEAGDLDENGELKRQRESSLLTVRQRAIFHGKNEEELVQLPAGYKNTTFTDEQLRWREDQAHKRRQLSIEKSEKHKRETVDRLLKKQEGKKATKLIREESNHPMFRYIDSTSSVTVCVPQGYSYPLRPQIASIPKPVEFCGVEGCSNVRKYACSKSGLSLCSLQCYRKAMSQC